MRYSGQPKSQFVKVGSMRQILQSGEKKDS